METFILGNIYFDIFRRRIHRFDLEFQFTGLIQNPILLQQFPPQQLLMHEAQPNCLNLCMQYCTAPCTTASCVDACRPLCDVQCEQVLANACEGSCLSQCGAICQTSLPCRQSCNTQCQAACQSYISSCQKKPCDRRLSLISKLRPQQNLLSTCQQSCNSNCLSNCQGSSTFGSCEPICRNTCLRTCKNAQQIVTPCTSSTSGCGCSAGYTPCAKDMCCRK
ncbi:hypothetical protein DICVIV_12338 [Dictyocaulus viviparus]|uniref:Cysteine rich repeat-containing domain protein n=1 Tax=Dictyocaulus viviparus TaxID=29172 RepID=A0A0D8XDH0_DICVI|nr:hypothetical protein DICVIV_12338 [Dictyocaulus viviparus]